MHQHKQLFFCRNKLYLRLLNLAITFGNSLKQIGLFIWEWSAAIDAVGQMTYRRHCQTGEAKCQEVKWKTIKYFIFTLSASWLSCQPFDRRMNDKPYKFCSRADNDTAPYCTLGSLGYLYVCPVIQLCCTKRTFRVSPCSGNAIFKALCLRIACSA